MREYVEKLMGRGEMRIVERTVDPRFELSGVLHASQQSSELPILFRSVKDTSLEVVSNLYGSRRRLWELIGASDGNFPKRWLEIIRAVRTNDREFMTNVAAPNDLIHGRLSDLPQITYWEKDAGPYITSAIFLAKEPDTGVSNLSFHRSMIVSDEELRIRLGTTHDLTRYQKKAEARGEALPAALLIGTSPEIFLAAGASLPYDTDELAVAAQIRGAPVPMRPCHTIDLSVPADTEIVVEGEILPNLLRPEGPFGEFMGYYVPVGNNHVFRVKHVSYRRGAYYHGLLCGSSEDIRLLEAATAARVYSSIVDAVPNVKRVAVHATLLCTVIAIDQSYDGHARHAALAALGSSLDYNKCVIVTDDDVDVHDLHDVWWAFLTRGRADTRTTIIPDVPGFYRDPHKDHWGKLIIDATKPLTRQAEFERRRIPGQERIALADYIARNSP